MPEPKIADALEASRKAFEDLKTEHDAALEQVASQGRVSAELKAKIEKIEADLDVKVAKAQANWDEIEKQMRRQKALESIGGPESAFQAELVKFNCQLASSYRHRGDIAGFKPLDVEHYKTYKNGVGLYMRRGVQGLDANPDLRAAMSIGSDPDGGYLVPADTSGRIVEFIYESSPMRQYASVRTTSRDRVQGRHDLDEAGATWVGEKTTRSRNTTPSLGKYETPIHQQEALLAVTQNELDDADLDVETWLGKKAGKKFSRAENTAYVTGTGTLKPRGFTTYASGTPSAATFNVIQRIATGKAAAFATDPNGPDLFIDMTAELKPAYLAQAVWAMRRTTLGTARKLKDSNGTYQIKLEKDQRGRPAFMIEGIVVAMFEDMAAIAGSSLSVALADFSEGYEIIDRSGIRVLRDPYSSKSTGEVELSYYKRVGGDVRNFDAIKLGKFAVS